MSLQQIIDQLHLVHAYPQPEFRHSMPLPKETERFWQPLTVALINERQPVDAEFHQFSRLPPEIRETIWWFALPAQRPFEINIRINDERRDSCIWAVGPFAMLRVCRQSRRIALSVYELRLELYASQEHSERVLCARPNTISRPGGHVVIYMEREHPPINIPLDSEVHSVVAWEDIPLGLMVQAASLEFVNIKYFWNWPPEENEEPMLATFWSKDSYERSKNRWLPPRLRDYPLYGGRRRR